MVPRIAEIRKITKDVRATPMVNFFEKYLMDKTVGITIKIDVL